MEVKWIEVSVCKLSGPVLNRFRFTDQKKGSTVLDLVLTDFPFASAMKMISWSWRNSSTHPPCATFCTSISAASVPTFSAGFPRSPSAEPAMIHPVLVWAVILTKRKVTISNVNSVAKLIHDARSIAVCSLMSLLNVLEGILDLKEKNWQRKTFIHSICYLLYHQTRSGKCDVLPSTFDP